MAGLLDRPWRPARLAARPPIETPCARSAVEVPEGLGQSAKLTKVTNHSEIPDLPKLFTYLADKAIATRDERGRLLLKLLDRQWGEWESRFGGTAATAPPWWQSTYHYYPGWKRSGPENSKALPCEFLRLLRSEAWVPVRGDGEPQPPKAVWVGNDDGGLGLASGRCLAVPVENEGLIQALGLRTRLTVDELLAELDARVGRDDSTSADTACSTASSRTPGGRKATGPASSRSSRDFATSSSRTGSISPSRLPTMWSGRHLGAASRAGLPRSSPPIPRSGTSSCGWGSPSKRRRRSRWRP